MNRIDWDELVQGHNRIYETRYRTVRQMIKGEIKKTNLDAFAKRLGVSTKSLIDKKLSLGIRHVKFPRLTRTRQLMKLHDDGKMKKMTIYQIIKATGACSSWVYAVIDKNKWEYKKGA